MRQFNCNSISAAVATLFTMLPVTHVWADSAPTDGVWSGKGQGGLLISSGNTNATSLNAKVDLSLTNGPWKHSFSLGGLSGKSAGILTSERAEGRYQLDRKINDAAFWFGSLDANRDLFSGFNYQATLAAGVGYKFIDTADTKFSGQAGLGYQRLQTQQLIKDAAGVVVQRINGEAEGSVVAVAGLNYEQNLSSTTKLLDKLAVTAGSKNTAVANDLGLAVSMSERLALSVGYGIRYNTKPAAGVKNLDQVTTVNIVYSFK